MKLIKPRTEAVFEKAEWAPSLPQESELWHRALSTSKSPWEINYKARRQAWVPREVAETGPRHTPQPSRTSRQWSYSSSQALNPLPGSSSPFTTVKGVTPTSYLGKLNSVAQSLYIMKRPFLLKHSASNLSASTSPKMFLVCIRENLETTNPFCILGDGYFSRSRYCIHMTLGDGHCLTWKWLTEEH